MINSTYKISEQLIYFQLILIILFFFVSSLEVNNQALSSQLNIQIGYFFDVYNLRKIFLNLILTTSLIIYFFLIKKTSGIRYFFLISIPLLGFINSVFYLIEKNYYYFFSNFLIPLSVVSIYYSISFINISYLRLKFLSYFLSILTIIIVILSYSFFNLDSFRFLEEFYWQNLSEKNAGLLTLYLKKIFFVTGILNPRYLICLMSIILNIHYMIKIKKIDFNLIFCSIILAEFILTSKNFYSLVSFFIFFICLFFYFIKKFYIFNKRLIILYLMMIFLSPLVITYTTSVVLKNFLVKIDYIENEILKDNILKKCNVRIGPNEFKTDNWVGYEFKGKFQKLFEIDMCYENSPPLGDKIFLLSSFAQRADMSDKFIKSITLENFFKGTNNINNPYYYENNEKIIINGFTHNSYLNILWRYGFFMYLLIFLFLLFELIQNKKNYFFIITLIIITFSQSLDDYLLGNRFEMTLIFWLILGILNNKKVNLKNSY